jgi:hypothetical protein
VLLQALAVGVDVATGATPVAAAQLEETATGETVTAETVTVALELQSSQETAELEEEDALLVDGSHSDQLLEEVVDGSHSGQLLEVVVDGSHSGQLLDVPVAEATDEVVDGSHSGQAELEEDELVLVVGSESLQSFQAVELPSTTPVAVLLEGEVGEPVGWPWLWPGTQRVTPTPPPIGTPTSEPAGHTLEREVGVVTVEVEDVKLQVVVVELEFCTGKGTVVELEVVIG